MTKASLRHITMERQCLRWWMTARPCIHPLQSEIQRQHQKPKTERQLVRSFTSFQMLHTHALLPQGFLTLRQMRWRWRWKGNGSEVTMRMRWQLLNRDARRGTQKRTGKGRTPIPTHLAQNGKKPWRAREEKAVGRRAKHRPEEGGRTEAPDTT